MNLLSAMPTWPLWAWLGLGWLLGAVTLLGLMHWSALPGVANVKKKRGTLPKDGLTELPTRPYFEKHLLVGAKACDSANTRMALLFIDLDGFKPVNDNYGHGHGDNVLAQVGKRLRVLARSGHLVARVGGDEFLLLVRDVQDNNDVALLARRLIKHLSMPYQVDEQEVSISCSVGIVVYPDYGGASKLIARADAAMYAAKRSGGSCYCFYTPAMDADAEEKFELLRSLREAVELRQFELYYQPKIDAKSGKITAAEALIRWQHPTKGLILPGVFIPVAERFGLMGAIGHWVIEDACRQSRAWRDQGLRMRVAINLSAQQMRQDDIAQRIGEALKRHRIDPTSITCEITESAAMEDTRTTQTTLKELGELGVHISIDDFGTGYSSLSYLRQLPAEELKIDRSFVVDIDSSPDARAVVDAVVKLAHALGLKVVAEGVENLRQQETLVQLGCDELQGYLFARPMTARALLLSSHQTHGDYASFRSSLFGITETREKA
jgi:diguanylate cyclase